VFKSLAGRSLALKSLHGKIVVLTFTAYDCPPCRTLEPKLKAFAHQSHGVVFLVISGDKPAAFSKLKARWANESAVQLVHDPANSAAEKFGSVPTPTMFVIDRNGRLASKENHGGDDGMKRLAERIEWAKKRTAS
jgi:peroxiredoxin